MARAELCLTPLWTRRFVGAHEQAWLWRAAFTESPSARATAGHWPHPERAWSACALVWFWAAEVPEGKALVLPIARHVESRELVEAMRQLLACCGGCRPDYVRAVSVCDSPPPTVADDDEAEDPEFRKMLLKWFP